MHMCPTSLFPICPSGRPTARPEVFMSAFGTFLNNQSYVGFFAAANALNSLLSLYPMPSVITKIVFCAIFKFSP